MSSSIILVHLPRTLEQLCLDTTPLPNILQYPAPVFQHRQSHESSAVDIRAPFPFHQSWQTNQEALHYGIDPKRHSLTEALPFSNISQRQLKVSLMCRRRTMLAAPMASTDDISNTLHDVSFFGRPLNPWPDVQFLVPQIPVHMPLIHWA